MNYAIVTGSARARSRNDGGTREATGSTWAGDCLSSCDQCGCALWPQCRPRIFSWVPLSIERTVAPRASAPPRRPRATYLPRRIHQRVAPPLADPRQFGGPQRRAKRDTGVLRSGEGALGNQAPPFASRTLKTSANDHESTQMGTSVRWAFEFRCVIVCMRMLWRGTSEMVDSDVGTRRR